jgi:branched-chain amino acid aminotransferase
LDGVTRDSLIQLAKDKGVEVEERRISTDDLIAAFRNNTITEAFGAGTAAVVAPINLIHIDGVDYKLQLYTINSLMNQLKQQLEDIRTGRASDIHNWNNVI